MAVKTHEKKLSKTFRSLLSFVLFVMLVLLSISVCAKSGFASRDTIVKQFTSYEYVSGVRSEMCNYASALYTENGVCDDNIENIFSYDAVKTVVASYYGYFIADDMEYSEQSYEKNITSVCSRIPQDIELQLKNTEFKYDSDTAEQIAESLKINFKEAVSLPRMNIIRTVLNVSSVALYAVIGVSAFFTAASALILFFIGTQRQRSVRAIAISFMTAGAYELVMALVVYIISCIKKVDLFPTFLSEQFLSYVYMSISSIVCCAGVLILISLMLAVAVWKMRKDK